MPLQFPFSAVVGSDDLALARVLAGADRGVDADGVDQLVDRRVPVVAALATARRRRRQGHHHRHQHRGCAHPGTLARDPRTASRGAAAAPRPS